MVDLLLDMARNPSNDPQKIARWMLTTSTCICNAIFEDANPSPLLYYYMRAMDKHYPDLVEEIVQIYGNEKLNEVIPVLASRDDFLGILWAAGSTFANGELVLNNDEIDITSEGVMRFHSIWKAPTETMDDPCDHSTYSSPQ